jgi:hypothetical protein
MITFLDDESHPNTVPVVLLKASDQVQLKVPQYMRDYKWPVWQFRVSSSFRFTVNFTKASDPAAMQKEHEIKNPTTPMMLSRNPGLQPLLQSLKEKSDDSKDTVTERTEQMPVIEEQPLFIVPAKTNPSRKPVAKKEPRSSSLSSRLSPVKPTSPTKPPVIQSQTSSKTQQPKKQSPLKKSPVKKSSTPSKNQKAKQAPIQEVEEGDYDASDDALRRSTKKEKKAKEAANKKKRDQKQAAK